MKTIEQKAKAYDEALKYAKSALDCLADDYICNHLTKDDIRGMYAKFFPELGGNEDEKIRKSLLVYFAKFKSSDMWDADFSFGDIVVWLEKQGEQKPSIIIPKFRVGDKVKKGYLTYTVEDINEESYKLQAYSKDGDKGSTVFLTIGYEKDYELVEQKPDTQHSTEWSVSDFRTWQYIVSDVLTKKDGIGQYLDSGECKKIAKYMQEEWGEKLGKEQAQEELGMAVGNKA